MKRKVLGVLAAMVVAGVSFAAVANGPYYAWPAWSLKIACSVASNCPRFIELADWNREAVLDRETGLVWEKAPSFPAGFTWLGAHAHCNGLSVGGREGWRLPTLQELTSLVDPASSSAPKLPAGHPFSVMAVGFWSATSGADQTFPEAWLASFSTAFPSLRQVKVGIQPVWCVRGGQGVDPQ
jgi:hypothetical protein